MIRYALIDSTNTVQNVILWDGVTDYQHGAGLTAVLDTEPPTAEVGGTYAGGVFSAAPAPAPVVPQSITRFQAMAAMSNAGLLTKVQTAVASASTLTQLAWANAQEFDRASPTIAELAAALNISSAKIDELFIAGASIIA